MIKIDVMDRANLTTALAVCQYVGQLCRQQRVAGQRRRRYGVDAVGLGVGTVDFSDRTDETGEASRGVAVGHDPNENE